MVLDIVRNCGEVAGQVKMMPVYILCLPAGSVDKVLETALDVVSDNALKVVKECRLAASQDDNEAHNNEDGSENDAAIDNKDAESFHS